MTKEEVTEIRSQMLQAMCLMQEACKANRYCEGCPLTELCDLMDRAPSRWGIKIKEEDK